MALWQWSINSEGDAQPQKVFIISHVNQIARPTNAQLNWMATQKVLWTIILILLHVNGLSLISTQNTLQCFLIYPTDEAASGANRVSVACWRTLRHGWHGQGLNPQTLVWKTTTLSVNHSASESQLIDMANTNCLENWIHIRLNLLF